MENQGHKLSFIGAGKMTTAICHGLLSKHVYKPDEIVASDISDAARKNLTQITGIACTNDNNEVIRFSNTVVLAVKPQIAGEVLTPLKNLFQDRLLISIAAGLSLARLSAWTGSERIIRVMPNTPVRVCQGASVYACSPVVTAADKHLVRTIFESVGIAMEMAEDKLDAVTALSGSGPAYVFEFIQALLDGADKVGLDARASLDLILQTISGATAMVRENLGSPEELRDAVTSPGGTTQAGLNVLKIDNFRALIANAVGAATQRSIELGREYVGEKKGVSV